MRVGFISGIERGSDRFAFGEHLTAPFGEQHLLRAFYESQSRLAPA
jgi:hypothetical protein